MKVTAGCRGFPENAQANPLRGIQSEPLAIPSGSWQYHAPPCFASQQLLQSCTCLSIFILGDCSEQFTIVCLWLAAMSFWMPEGASLHCQRKH